MVLHSNITFQQQLILGKDVPWLGSFFSSIQSIKPENSTTTCYICIHKYNLYTYNTCSILTHCNDAVSQHCLGRKLLVVCHHVNIPMANICEQIQNISIFFYMGKSKKLNFLFKHFYWCFLYNLCSWRRSQPLATCWTRPQLMVLSI